MPDKPLRFPAELEFVGREIPPPFSGEFSGIRPSFNYGGDLVACEIECPSEIDWSHVGRFAVSVRLFYSTAAHSELSIDDEFHLNVGGRVFAVGTVLGAPETAA